MNTDLLPPQDLRAEMCVLSACMVGVGEAVDEARQIVSPESFYATAHRLLFQSICNVRDAGYRVDQETVWRDLAEKKLSDRVDMSDFLEIVRNYPVPEGIGYMAGKVRDAYLRRSILNHHVKMQELAHDPHLPVADLVAASQDIGVDPGAVPEKSAFVHVSEIVDQCYARLKRRQELDGAIFGLPTGIDALDDLLDGLNPKNSIIIAARPAMGKTAFGLSIAWNSAKVAPVAFVSIEMGVSELVDRMAVMVSGMDSQVVRRGKLAPEQNKKVQDAYSEVCRARLFFTEIRDMGQIEREAKRLKKEHDIGLLVIDYLQLADAPTGDHDRNREQAVSAISRALKHTSKALNIPIVTLAQLNRASEQREGKRPYLGDLRESGSIEQDADVVMLLHRPEYYGKEKEDGEDLTGLMEINVAKQRNGPTDMIKAFFCKQTGRFQDWGKHEKLKF